MGPIGSSEGAIRPALAVRIALPAPEAPTALRAVSRGVSGTPQGGHWGPFGSPRGTILVPSDPSGSRPETIWELRSSPKRFEDGFLYFRRHARFPSLATGWEPSAVSTPWWVVRPE